MGTEPGFFNATEYFVDRNVRQGRGHEVALYTAERDYTYNDVQKMVNKTANALASLGLRVEDRVMLLMLDIPAFFASFWGAIRIGAIPVPINTMMTPDDYAYYLNDSRARALILSEELWPVISQIKEPLPFLRDLILVHPTEGAHIPFRQKYQFAPSTRKTAPTVQDDVGFWLYSSGSTGSPKGAIHSQRDPRVVTDSYARDTLGIGEDDIIYSAARLFFGYGLGNSNFFALGLGAAAVLDPRPPKPQTCFENLQRFGATVFFGVPTLYGQMLEYQEKLDRDAGGEPDPNGEHAFSTVRLCVSAGEALPADLFHRFKQRYGLEILDGIGSTEMLHIFLSNRPGDVRPGSTGKPVPGYELRLLDDAGGEVPRGEIGTLHVKGDSAAQAYWRRRDKTRATMVGEWINTGDKYYVDEDGYYWCCGRGDDMLKVGGIWVSPVEVEGIIVQHEAVRECAVVGHADDQGLVKPKAFVKLSDGYDPSDELAAELQAFVRDNAANYKYPRWVEFLDELPKSSTGKIQRFKLR